jgi:sigma-E factor negative regulatory protein RseA
MNAEHTSRVQAPHESAQAPEAAREDLLVCALLDDELLEAEFEHWLSDGPDVGQVAERGRIYQLIGESLRGQAPVVADAPSAFLAGLQTRLREEAPAPWASVAPTALAAALVAVQVRASAANDALFRWKLVAGLASLAAVTTVSWTLLSTGPGASGVGITSPQLAQTQPAPGTSTALAAAAPVVVNTRQGVVIRDAGLEALMAEHRQHGGVSALQMPAGFLRNATHDPDAR